jgi:hypothetical protein
MASFVLTLWNGMVFVAKDFADKPNPFRCILGTEKRIPLSESLAKWPLGLITLVLIQRGEIG